MDYILLAIFILLSGYYSGLEMGIYCLNRVRLQHRVDRGWRTARILVRHLRKPQVLLCTILVGNNVVNFVASAVFTRLLENRTSLIQTELFTTIILSPILLVFAEVTPKNLFRQRSDWLLYRLAPTLDISHKLFYPVVVLLKYASKIPFIFSKRSRKEDYTFLNPKRLMYFFSEWRQDGALSRYQNLMTRNILRLGRVPLNRVMIQAKDVVSVSYNVEINKLSKLIKNKPYSRLPVYGEDKTKIIGTINLLEFLSTYKKGDKMEQFVSDATYLDENLSVDEALLILQKSRQRMGIVVDKSNRTRGLVTIKDLVEEIVGELAVW